MLVCLHANALGVLTCLACLRALAFSVFMCLGLDAFSMLACFISLRAHMSHMLAVLKYLTCLRVCVLP